MDLASIVVGAIVGGAVSLGFAQLKHRLDRKREHEEFLETAALQLFESLLAFRAACVSEEIESVPIAQFMALQNANGAWAEAIAVVGRDKDTVVLAAQMALARAFLWAYDARYPVERPLTFLDEAWDELAKTSEAVRRRIDARNLNQSRD